MELERETLRVEGMSCSHCVAHVTRALEALAGVSEVKVDLKAQRVEVGHSGADPAAFAPAIAAAGYTVVE